MKKKKPKRELMWDSGFTSERKPQPVAALECASCDALDFETCGHQLKGNRDENTDPEWAT